MMQDLLTSAFADEMSSGKFFSSIGLIRAEPIRQYSVYLNDYQKKLVYSAMIATNSSDDEILQFSHAIGLGRKFAKASYKFRLEKILCEKGLSKYIQ